MYLLFVLLKKRHTKKRGMILKMNYLTKLAKEYEDAVDKKKGRLDNLSQSQRAGNVLGATGAGIGLGLGAAGAKNLSKTMYMSPGLKAAYVGIPALAGGGVNYLLGRGGGHLLDRAERKEKKKTNNIGGGQNENAYITQEELDNALEAFNKTASEEEIASAAENEGGWWSNLSPSKKTGNVLGLVGAGVGLVPGLHGSSAIGLKGPAKAAYVGANSAVGGANSYLQGRLAGYLYDKVKNRGDEKKTELTKVAKDAEMPKEKGLLRSTWDKNTTGFKASALLGLPAVFAGMHQGNKLVDKIDYKNMLANQVSNKNYKLSGFKRHSIPIAASLALSLPVAHGADKAGDAYDRFVRKRRKEQAREKKRVMDDTK